MTKCNQRCLTSNLYLHIFTGKFVRFPPFSNIHVENLKSPRGYFFFSTWRRFISSEVSFHSSEVSFDSSEESFILHVEISKYPRGNHFSPTQRRFDMLSVLNYCNELALSFPWVGDVSSLTSNQSSRSGNESFLTYFRFLSSHTTVRAVRHTAA